MFVIWSVSSVSTPSVFQTKLPLVLADQFGSTYPEGGLLML